MALRTAILEVLESIDGTLSSRQIYYQLVSAGHVENKATECGRVGRLLVKMRRDGSVPYSRIVDRTRSKHVRPSWDGVEDILTACAQQFRRDYWSDRPTVPMIACEKQALEGIFAETVDEFGVPLWVIRGFNSESFEFEWAEDIKSINEDGRNVAIYYFGDWDPSGLCIENNSRSKLEKFGAVFTWSRAGLLLEDFDRFDLVNVPVKKTDSRAKGLSTFGSRAAELDALRPEELRRRILGCIEEHLDHDQWARLVRGDELQRADLKMVAINWDAAVDAVREAG